MKLYRVSFDYMIDGAYQPQETQAYAHNAKEACQRVKDAYWSRIDYLYRRRGYGEMQARRMTPEPRHIKAKAV